MRGSKLVPELKDLDNEQRPKCSYIPRVVYHWFWGDMSETYTYISGHYDVKPELKMTTYGKTRGHNTKIFTARYNKNTRNCFYSIRVVHVRNQLPEDIANTKSLSIFKKELDN